MELVLKSTQLAEPRFLPQMGKPRRQLSASRLLSQVETHADIGAVSGSVG